METSTALNDTLLDLADLLEAQSKLYITAAAKLTKRAEAMVEEDTAAAVEKIDTTKRKKKAVKKKAAPKQEAPETEEPETEEPEQEEITLKTTQDLAKAYVQSYGVPEARTILKNFGVKKVSEADEEHLPDIYAAFKDAMA